MEIIMYKKKREKEKYKSNSIHDYRAVAEV